MSTPTLLISLFVLCFEFQNVLAWSRRRVLVPGTDECWDFTIIVPVFGSPSYFDGRAALERYRDNVIVALETGTPLMRDFGTTLEAEGFRVAHLEARSPNPAILMRMALRHVDTTYALRLDADTLLPDSVPNAIAAVKSSNADLCSVKVEVANRVSVPAKLQALEYRIAMLGRHIRPWLTSGACLIGKTSSLREIYEHHSLWSPGEDIETGRTALALRMRIRHCDIVVRTDAPITWRALARQRQLWWAGNFRHFVINADRNLLHLPVKTFYTLLAIWLSISTRWWSTLDLRALVVLLPLLLISYAIVTAVCNLQVLSPWMLVFPLYAFAQTLVMPPLGVITYVRLAHRRGLGRYRFAYRRPGRRHVRFPPAPQFTEARP